MISTSAKVLICFTFNGTFKYLWVVWGVDFMFGFGNLTILVLISKRLIQRILDDCQNI